MAEREDDSFRAIVTTLGGWPVISQRWDDSDFDLATLLGRLRAWYGYTPLVTMYVSVDEKNSVAHRIVVRQQTVHVRFSLHNNSNNNNNNNSIYLP